MAAVSVKRSIVLFEKDEQFSENGINQRFKKHGFRISTKQEKGAAQTTMPHRNECVLISNENSYEQFLQHPCFVQYLQQNKYARGNANVKK